MVGFKAAYHASTTPRSFVSGTEAVERDSLPHRKHRICSRRRTLEPGTVSLGSRLLHPPRSRPDLCPVLVLESS